MSSSQQPDFEFLRRLRDEQIKQLQDAVSRKQGWNRSEIGFYCADMSSCYCAYPDSLEEANEGEFAGAARCALKALAQPLGEFKPLPNC